MLKKISILIYIQDKELLDEVIQRLGKLNSILPLMARSGLDALSKIDNQVFPLLVIHGDLKHKDLRFIMDNLPEKKIDRRPEQSILFTDDQNVTGDSNLKEVFEFQPNTNCADNIAEIIQSQLRRDPKEEKKQKEIEKKAKLEILTALIHSTLLILSKTAHCEFKKDKISTKDADRVKGGISGKVKMTSALFDISMAIIFNEIDFIHVSNKMINESCIDINDGNRDAIGALVNQISAYTKTMLNKRGHEVRREHPEILEEKNHLVEHEVEGNVITITFSDSDGHSFYLELVLS